MRSDADRQHKCRTATEYKAEDSDASRGDDEREEYIASDRRTKAIRNLSAVR